MSMWAQNENPRAATLGFSFRLIVAVISVWPFANVVGCYTCCNRE